MSVERKRNGALRLACDGEDCDRKFVPQRSFTDAAQLRRRAQMYAWNVKPTLTAQRSLPGTEPTATKDLCPECGGRGGQRRNKAKR